MEPDYFPYLGLIGDTGVRSTNLSLSTYDDFSKGAMTGWFGGMNVWRVDDMNGSLFADGINMYGGVNYRNGTGAYLDAVVSQRQVNHDRNLSFNYYWGGRDLYRNGGVTVDVGKLANGDHLAWKVWQGWQISEKLSIQGSYEYARIKEPSPEAFSAKQLVTSLVYDIDNERTLSGRVISKKGNANLYLAYRQRVRRGTDAYIIFGDPNADNTRNAFTLKLIRMF